MSTSADFVFSRRRGRPRGTSYINVDRAFHERMRQFLVSGLEPTPTSAAKRVVNGSPDEVYGCGSVESKIKRLVRTYDRFVSEN